MWEEKKQNWAYLKIIAPESGHAGGATARDKSAAFQTSFSELFFWSRVPKRLRLKWFLLMEEQSVCAVKTSVPHLLLSDLMGSWFTSAIKTNKKNLPSSRGEQWWGEQWEHRSHCLSVMNWLCFNSRSPLSERGCGCCSYLGKSSFCDPPDCDFCRKSWERKRG